jgi:hypothetical protein
VLVGLRGYSSESPHDSVSQGSRGNVGVFAGLFVQFSFLVLAPPHASTAFFSGDVVAAYLGMNSP